MLRPYWHVLQRGGRRAPTPLPHHAVDPGPHFITLGVKVLSSHLPASDAPTQLRQRRSHDQAHGTAAQAEQRRREACFPSMINAVRSSADATQVFKDQASSSRAASTRRKASWASFSRAASTRRKFTEGFFFASSIDTTQGQPGFFFARSLDTTQVHGKPSKTSGLLLHEQPHRRSDAMTN